MSTSARGPSALLRAMEIRAPFEYATMAATAPLLGRLADGDGHPVLVLPGFTAGDRSTRPLRAVLRRQGYHTHGWRLGNNIGPTPEIVEGLADRFHTIHQETDEKVSLVGWSLGGIYARELARRFPDQVRQVITLGSPFRMVESDGSSASRAWEALRHRHVERPDLDSRPELEKPPLEVPATSIYTRTDGIVRWQKCLEADGPQRENIEVSGSHCGLGFNPAAVIAVSDRLRQPKGEWRPFQPTLGQRALFPFPARWHEHAA